MRRERLVRGPAKALPAGSPSTRVRNLVARRADIIAGVAEKHPALAKLEVKSFAINGVPKIKHEPPSNRQEIAALAKMYAALDKAE